MSRAPRWTVVALALALLVALAGCQMRVAVDIAVESDGSGVVTVSVGLDEAALARAGDLDQVLRVDDLRAAGWTVTPAEPDGAGTTWVRASKPFADPAGFALVMNEVTGPEGAFRDFVLERDEGTFSTSYAVSGTVDLTAGPTAFSDAALTEALGGDPFGGTLTAVEEADGRPAAEMVSWEVSVDLPGADEPEVATPSFADAEPTTIDVTSSTGSWLDAFWIWGLVLLVVVTVAIVGRGTYVSRRRRARRPGNHFR